MARPRVALTKEQIAAYLRQRGLACPWCGGDVLDSSGAVFSDLDVLVPVQCGKCDRRWHDVYKLADIVPEAP